MAQYQIKKGDTLSAIANQYGTTTEELMNLNKGNPAVKSKDLIILGGNLNLPEGTQTKASPRGVGAGSAMPLGGPMSSMPPATDSTKNIKPVSLPPAPEAPVTPPADSTSQGVEAVSSSSVPSDEFSASYATFGKELMNIEQELANLDKTPTTDMSGIEKAAHESRLSAIEGGAARNKEEVAGVARTGELQQKRAQELLGMSPAAIRYNIDTYIAESDNFVKSVARSLEQIESDKNNAIVNEDYQYANQLNQEKISLLQAQRTALTDRMNFVTTAMNLMLTGKQEQRATTSDAIAKVQNSYALGIIPSREDWQAAGFQGVPPAALNTVKWGTPYEMDGKLVQQNAETGEIKVLSLPYDTFQTPEEKTNLINSWANSVARNPAYMSHVPSELKNEVQVEVDNRKKKAAAAAAATPPQRQWYDDVLNFISFGLADKPPAQTTESSAFNAGSAGVTGGPGSSLDDLITQANSIVQ